MRILFFLYALFAVQTALCFRVIYNSNIDSLAVDRFVSYLRSDRGIFKLSDSEVLQIKNPNYFGAILELNTVPNYNDPESSFCFELKDTLSSIIVNGIVFRGVVYVRLKDFAIYQFGNQNIESSTNDIKKIFSKHRIRFCGYKVEKDGKVTKFGRVIGQFSYDYLVHGLTFEGWRNFYQSSEVYFSNPDVIPVLLFTLKAKNKYISKKRNNNFDKSENFPVFYSYEYYYFHFYKLTILEHGVRSIQSKTFDDSYGI